MQDLLTLTKQFVFINDDTSKTPFNLTVQTHVINGKILLAPILSAFHSILNLPRQPRFWIQTPNQTLLELLDPFIFDEMYFRNPTIQIYYKEIPVQSSLFSASSSWKPLALSNVIFPILSSQLSGLPPKVSASRGDFLNSTSSGFSLCTSSDTQNTGNSQDGDQKRNLSILEATSKCENRVQYGAGGAIINGICGTGAVSLFNNNNNNNCSNNTTPQTITHQNYNNKPPLSMTHSLNDEPTAFFASPGFQVSAMPLKKSSKAPPRQKIPSLQERQASAEPSRSSPTAQGQNQSMMEEEFKKERTKQRSIRQVIICVKKWRSVHKTATETGRVNLVDAAKMVGISKKSLDDYFCQLRLGQKYSFDFIANLDQKIGVLRNFVKQHRPKVQRKDKNEKHPKKLKIIDTLSLEDLIPSSARTSTTYQTAPLYTIKTQEPEPIQAKQINASVTLPSTSAPTEDVLTLDAEMAPPLDQEHEEELQNQFYQKYDLLMEEPFDPFVPYIPSKFRNFQKRPVSTQYNFKAYNTFQEFGNDEDEMVW